MVKTRTPLKKEEGKDKIYNNALGKIRNMQQRKLY
jgi:hypothetical protein